MVKVDGKEVTEGKGLFQSQTFWGAFIAALPALDTLAVTLGLFAGPIFVETATILTTAFGSLLSIFGRIKAEKKIKGLF